MWGAAVLLHESCLRHLRMVGEQIKWLQEMADVEGRVAIEHDLGVVQVGFDSSVKRAREVEVGRCELSRITLVTSLRWVTRSSTRYAARSRHCAKSRRSQTIITSYRVPSPNQFANVDVHHFVLWYLLHFGPTAAGPGRTVV